MKYLCRILGFLLWSKFLLILLALLRRKKLATITTNEHSIRPSVATNPDFYSVDFVLGTEFLVFPRELQLSLHNMLKDLQTEKINISFSISAAQFTQLHFRLYSVYKSRWVCDYFFPNYNKPTNFQSSLLCSILLF